MFFKNQNMKTQKLTVNNIEQVVNSYKTKYKKGFTDDEMKSFVKEHSLDKKKIGIALGTHTAIVINNKIITYRHDIIKAIRCVLEKRDERQEEFD